MTSARPTDHSIPATLDEVLRWIEAGHAPPGTAAATSVRLLVALLRLEAGARADTLKRLHADTADAGGGPESPAYGALVGALRELLQRANYREIGPAELKEAFESQALSAVRIEVDMDAFSAMHIHARGKERRSEVIVSWFGLRRRRIDFDVLDRVFVLTCMSDAHAQAARVKGHGGADIRPMRLNLKLFRGIPVPDMEMLLPNTRLRMRRLDQAVVFVPAAVSIGLAASKVLFSITAIIGLVKFWIGLRQDHPVASGGWGLVAAGSFTLLGITMGAWTKYQKRRLEYANAHSKTLYFQTLDSEAGAILRVLDEAFEQEAKEAVLAWAALHAHGPATERALDERIERWIHERTGRHCDFEVDDALAKLERLGVAARAGDTWTAVAPDAAVAGLRARWDAAAG